MNTWSEPNTLFLVIAGQAVVIFVFLICLIFLAVRTKRIRKQFNQLLKGSTKENLESILERLLKRLSELEEDHHLQGEQIKSLAQSLKGKKGNVGVIRFNAFAYEGSDLSFSIAIIDENTNGVVLTSIYGREESRVYAKPLDNGSSNYHLTSEEIEAIQKAKENLADPK